MSDVQMSLFSARRDGREGMVTVVDYEGRIVGSMGVETWANVLAEASRKFLPRCTCSWRGVASIDEEAARAEIEAHLADEADPNVGPNCAPWIEAHDA